jgi:hypothetical protein
MMITVNLLLKRGISYLINRVLSYTSLVLNEELHFSGSNLLSTDPAFIQYLASSITWPKRTAHMVVSTNPDKWARYWCDGTIERGETTASNHRKNVQGRISSATKHAVRRKGINRLKATTLIGLVCVCFRVLMIGRKPITVLD